MTKQFKLGSEFSWVFGKLNVYLRGVQTVGFRTRVASTKVVLNVSHATGGGGDRRAADARATAAGDPG